MMFLWTKRKSDNMNRLIKLCIFDLDDTLYDEMTYVKSGLAAVASHIANLYSIDKTEIYRSFYDAFLKHGRGKVFDIALPQFNIIPTEAVIQKLVQIYRSHIPSIELFLGVTSLLNVLRNRNIYRAIITDTNWRVQERKVKALGIGPYVDAIVYTDQDGCKKPDPRIYNPLFEKFGVRGEEVVVVGDDPSCDFIEAKKRGAFTIRIRIPGSRLANVNLERIYEADKECFSFNECMLFITQELILTSPPL